MAKAKAPPTPLGWTLNIVGHEIKPAGWFLAHPKNYRIHPKAQRDATAGSLDDLGWVKSVTVNRRTSDAWGPEDRGVHILLDGHDRLTLALARGPETPIPVEYVDLTPDQEDLFLLVIDEITARAGKDRELMARLMAHVRPGSAGLQQLCADLYEQAHPTTYAPDTTDAHYAEHPFADQAVPPDRDGTGEGMPGAVRHFQIFLSAEDHAWFMATLTTLAARYDTENYTDTLLAALREVADD